ncbi:MULTISPECIES: hypothetical protein [Mycobacterium avium complex (MAC)]|uniref:Uncharacterized protein n=1 Tax=Mycobacterium colombiense TaxID=339268 RepID=A0A329LJJ4_9MYCO|nr:MULTISPECIES: hypothetical protein [Mycobacterium avium complex (MAC)]RAV08131.1 hypothetical protein DQP57_17440 [Mycobacterium colombiense]
MRKPTARQIEALSAVAAGRVQWGNAYPDMARRGHTGPLVFLIDGHSVYGGQHATYSRLAELGWIVERTDLLPLKTVPARTRISHTITGSEKVIELPEHSAPADDGWRAKVELTDAGQAALHRATGQTTTSTTPAIERP